MYPEITPTNQSHSPLQIRLVDLFGGVTLCALMLAIASPFIRQLRTANQFALIAVLSGQGLLVALVMLWAAKGRKKLLAVSGRAIGVGYCGEGNWVHWPVVRSILTMLLIATVQLTFAMAVSFNPLMTLTSPAFLLYQFQISLFFGFACSRYIWRVFPNSVEFFDQGISLDGMNLVPWQRIAVRDSEFFPNRIVVVVRTQVGSIEGDTHVVQVSDGLRTTIAAIAKEPTKK